MEQWAGIPQKQRWFTIVEYKNNIMDLLLKKSQNRIDSSWKAIITCS